MTTTLTPEGDDMAKMTKAQADKAKADADTAGQEETPSMPPADTPATGIKPGDLTDSLQPFPKLPYEPPTITEITPEPISDERLAEGFKAFVRQPPVTVDPSAPAQHSGAVSGPPAQHVDTPSTE